MVKALTAKARDAAFKRRGVVAIYGLVDPRDDIVRYVGQSVSPYARCGQHISNAKSTLGYAKKNKRDLWIEELLSLHLRPQLRILEEVEPVMADLAERRWIGKYWNTGIMKNAGYETAESSVLLRLDYDLTTDLYKIIQHLKLPEGSHVKNCQAATRAAIAEMARRI